MDELNFEHYFENKDIKYYDSKYIITVLENILGGCLDDIKNKIKNTQIVVNEEQIREYLEKKFEEEDLELKKRVEKPKTRESKELTKEDIIRLITPTIYNISYLGETVTKANDLSTYLTFKMSKHSLLKNDLSERDIYPTKSLQIKDLYYDYIKGNVPLSDNQRTKLKEEQNKIMKNFLKIIIDL